MKCSSEEKKRRGREGRGGEGKGKDREEKRKGYKGNLLLILTHF